MTANERISNFKFQISNSTLVILLILLHLLIVLPLGYLVNIWADEASTLYTTQFGVVHAFQHALADEKQAPLYFWFLSLWREINNSIFFARFFSIICSCFAVRFFNDLARRFFDSKRAMCATAFFAVHPYLIWASLEIRVYAPVILLSILLLNLFGSLYFGERNFAENEKTRSFFLSNILFVLLAAAALYANYYLGFLLVGMFAALLIRGKWRESAVYLMQMFFAGIAFLPLVWSVKSQFAANTSGFQSAKSVVDALQILWGIFLTFILPTEIFTTDVTTAISIVRVWLVRFAILAVIFLFLKNRQKPSENTFVFGTIAAVITAFLFAAYFLIGGDYVGVRHAAVLFAPFVLFTFSLLPGGEKEKRRKGEKEKDAQFQFSYLLNSTSLQLLISAVILGFFAYSIYSLYPNLSKRGDWARAADFIEKNERSNQPIIIFTTFDALALPYYYHGANQILPNEKFFDFELEAETGSADSWRRQTEFIISEIPTGAPEIWLLTNDKCAVKDACAPLENFVESNYTIVEEKQFYSETVRLLRKK